MFFNYAILVLQLAPLAFCAHILAVTPTPSYSHQIAFRDFFTQLSLRGHKVTVITPDPQKNKKLTNLTEIDVHSVYEIFEGISGLAEKTLTMWNFHRWVHDMTFNISKALLSHPEIKDLLHDKKKHFDVLILEWLFPELLGFAEIYNCPTILISSLDVYTVIHHKMGNNAPLALYPDHGTPLYAPLNFRERITSAIYYLHTKIFYDYVSYPLKEKLMSKHFNTTSTIHTVLDNVDMLFLNVNPILQPVMAIGPSTVNTAGLRDISPKPLPKDLAKFLDSATEGFLYFSLGTNVKSKYLQEKSLKAIFDALGELPLTVLWKFEVDEDTIIDKPENVKLIKWAPQLGVLAHPNIRVFVTQGGLQSMEEAVYNEVPCVVIPFFADQHQNARLMKGKGFAEIVGRHPYIKKEELKTAIEQVINNPKYKNSVRMLKRLSFDIPMTGLEKATWWTEYVIRNKGAKHLRNPAADLPAYQYYLLDVIGFFILVILVMVSIIFVLSKRIIKLFKLHLSGKLDFKKQKKRSE